jgi:hypothetical protein
LAAGVGALGYAFMIADALDQDGSDDDLAKRDKTAPPGMFYAWEYFDDNQTGDLTYVIPSHWSFEVCSGGDCEHGHAYLADYTRNLIPEALGPGRPALDNFIRHRTELTPSGGVAALRVLRQQLAMPTYGRWRQFLGPNCVTFGIAVAQAGGLQVPSDTAGAIPYFKSLPQDAASKHSDTLPPPAP